MDESLKSALLDSNPWWKGEFPKMQIRPRELYGEVEKYMTKRQIIGVYGLRRVGKSYLLYHLIDKLLKAKTEPKSILYFSYDDFSDVRLDKLLSSAEELAGRKPSFVFLDEAQKPPNWAEQVKRAYDAGGIKFVISGSESLFLKKISKESLAGRIFEFEAKPLTFGEYLQFMEIENKPLFDKEIEKALGSYLLTGGFPELVDENDPLFIRKYLKEGVIDKAIYREIPKRFSIDDPSVLEQMMNIVISHPGIMIDKTELAKTLGLYRATVSKYLFYLESAFLVRSLHNYSKSRSTSERKLKKYYPGFSPLALGARDDAEFAGKSVEAVCVLHLDAKFFWRTPQKDEVDIVIPEPLMPIEVKYRNSPDEGSMMRFAWKFKVRKGMVITKETEVKKTFDGVEVRFVPLQKWLLEKAGNA